MTTKKVATTSKMSKARVLYKKMRGTKTRQQILGAFEGECGLTPNGSATYFQKLKKEFND